MLLFSMYQSTYITAVPDKPEVNLLPVYSDNNTLIRLIFAIKQMVRANLYIIFNIIE